MVKGLSGGRTGTGSQFSAEREPPPRRRDRGGRWRVPARHAGPRRRLAPSEDGRGPPSPTGPRATSRYVGGIDLCHSRARRRRPPRRPPGRSDAPTCTADTRRGTTSSSAIRGPGGRRCRGVLPRAVERPGAADPQPDLPAARPAATHEDTPADSAAGAAAARPAGRASTGVQVLRTYPYRRRGYPFAPRRRAQHRPRLREGARPGPLADLHRGPVPLVGRGRRRLRARRSGATRSCA